VAVARHSPAAGSKRLANAMAVPKKGKAPGSKRAPRVAFYRREGGRLNVYPDITAC
jgi:hypothetical protein